MAKFYALINRANQPLPSQDLVERMYRLLDEATKLIDDPKIQARLDDLTLLKMVLDKVKTDGLMPTLDAVRSKLDQPPLGVAPQICY